MTFLGPENFVRFEKHQKAFSGALRGAFRAREVLGSFEKRTPERDLNLGPPDFKSSAPTTRPSCLFSLRWLEKMLVTFVSLHKCLISILPPRYVVQCLERASCFSVSPFLALSIIGSLKCSCRSEMSNSGTLLWPVLISVDLLVCVYSSLSHPHTDCYISFSWSSHNSCHVGCLVSYV